MRPLSRRRALPLLALAALSVSCELPLRAARTELPAVSAAPASLAAPAATPKRDATADAISRMLLRHHTGLAPFEIERLARTIAEEARAHELSPSLVLGVMHVESRFYNFAVSPVGALGLMQVLPSTGAEVADAIGVRWHGPQSLFEPETNVRIGVAYLKALLDRFDGDLPTALAAYNWGPGHIGARLRRGQPMPTVYPGLVLESAAARPLERRS